MAFNKVRQYGNRAIPKLKDKVEFTDIVNDSVSGGTLLPLSAEAGKSLRDDLNQEVADRSQGVVDLVDGASTGYSTLKRIEDKLVQEVTDRSDAITQEVADRDAAILAEKTRAEAEETAIRNLLSSQDSAASSVLVSEINRAKTAEQANATAIAQEKTRAESAEGVLTSDLGTLSDSVSANKTAIEGALTVESNARQAADSALSTRLVSLESLAVAGVYWKGSVQNMAELDGLVESEVLAGQAYYVKDEKDVYVVIEATDGDHQPAGYTTKSFLKVADFNELSGLVNAERNRATAEEVRVEGLVTVETASRISEISRVEGVVSAEVNRAKAAEVVNADAIAAEETRATAAEGTITEAVAKEVTDRQTAVSEETARATAAEQVNADALAAEIVRAKGEEARVEAKSDAGDLALDGRLLVIEGDKTIVGSVANAQHSAQSYADKWMPQAMVEGTAGNLRVVGDYVTLNYAPMPAGIIFNEIVVYAGDGDSEAIAVNVANISGSQVTLDTVNAGEFDGKICKVHYFFREGDQTGAGMGVAGEGGAGV